MTQREPRQRGSERGRQQGRLTVRVIPRRRQRTEGRRRVRPMQQRVRGRQTRRTQHRQCRTLGHAHTSMSPQVGQQFLGTREPFTTIGRVPRDPVADVGQVGGGGQRRQLGMGIGGRRRIMPEIRRGGGRLGVVALAAPGRTSRGRLPQKVRAHAASGAIRVSAHRGQRVRLYPPVVEVGTQTSSFEGVVLRHQAVGHQIHGERKSGVAGKERRRHRNTGFEGSEW